jgi:Domain of unknown function (DUF4440)
MNRFASLLTVVALLAFAGSMHASAADPGGAEAPPKDSLFDTIRKLDAAVFDAFNHCSSPAELQLHANYFAPEVEFYHDTGGVTWTRDQMIANTARNACGNYRRELVAGSLKVFPIKDFGAIEQGAHRFCRAGSDVCEGMADFVIVWRQQGTSWQITRVLSYGHRPTE